MAQIPTFFADGVVEATVRHGTARFTLAVQDGKGQPVPTGLLVVPLAQLPALSGAMNRLMREVEAKTREGAPAAPQPPAPAEEAPEAFRFQR